MSQHTQPRLADDASALRDENRRLRRRIDRTEARERERQGEHLDRLERVADASQLAVFDWMDTARDEIYFTAAAYAALGYASFSYVPSYPDLRDAVHEADRAAFDRDVRRAIYERTQLHCEVRLRRADGAYHYFEITGLATVSVDGEVTRFTGALRDIEERHRMRAEVALLHERLALVIRGTRAGVWDWLDMSSDEVVWSDSLLRLIGYDDPAYEMSLAVFWSLIHPDDVAEVEGAVALSRETGVDFEVEYRLRFRGRGYRWVRSAGALVRGAGGAALRLTGAIVDIHEERVLRQRLTDDSEQLGLALQAAAAGVWDWQDVTRDEVVLSEGMLALLGYASAEVEQTVQGFWALIHEDDCAPVRAAMDATLATGGRFDVVYRIRFRDGGYRWVRSTGTPVCDAAGHPARLTGSITDVHEAEAHRLELAAAARHVARLRGIAERELLGPLRHVADFCDLVEANGLDPQDVAPLLAALRLSASRAIEVASDLADR